MGDCRMRLLVSKKLLPSEYRDSGDTKKDNNNNNSQQSQSEWYTVLNKIFSSDSTVREVIDDAKLVLPLLKQQQQTRLWDCTVHPPKDITDWPLDKYSDVKGLKSKTLFDAGWFPSGTLRVSLKCDGVPNAAASSLQYDDHQYNLPDSDQQHHHPSTAAAATTVQLVGSNEPMMPSQVLHSVTQRFEGKEGDDDDQALSETHRNALKQRRQNQKARQQKEQERFQKLESRIRHLDEQQNKKKKSNKPVSDQVKRMLIKSRATGAESLKAQDRVYFQIVVDLVDDDDDDDEKDDGNSSTEVFRYFSIQDTVSRILSQVTEPPKKKPSSETRQSELLIKTTTKPSNQKEEVVYRRLPGMMRVYEAIEQKYMQPEFNNIVIRWYAPEREEPTTSVLEDKEEVESATTILTSAETSDPQAMDVDDPSVGQISADNIAPPSKNTGMVTDGATIIVDDNLANLIRTMDNDEEQQKTNKKKKTTTKSSSTTSTKLRQMLIKGKAKGDGKRIKMEDRFFFELVTVVVDKCESSFAYLGKKDPLGRILRDCVKASLSATNRKESDFELLVPVGEGQGSNQFRRLDNLSMTFQEAETAKLIQPFGRLVVRFHTT